MSDTPRASPPTEGTNEGTQRRRGQPRVGGRGRPSNRTGSQGRGGSTTPQRPVPRKFIGKEESLGDEFVYQHTDGREASDQYTTTTDEIVRYSSTKYKNGADVERSLGDGTKLIITMPGTPVGTGTTPVIPDTVIMVWKMKVQLALQRTSMLESNLESTHCRHSYVEKGNE
jgi:hypothetical protein